MIFYLKHLTKENIIKSITVLSFFLSEILPEMQVIFNSIFNFGIYAKESRDNIQFPNWKSQGVVQISYEKQTSK